MKNLMTLVVVGVIAYAAYAFFTRDGEGDHLVDLDKVLDAFVTVIDQDRAAAQSAAGAATPPAATPATADAAKTPATTPAQDAAAEAKTQEFLGRYAVELNKVQPMPQPVGVRLADDGAIEGFVDADADGQPDDGGTVAFKVEVDAERNRVIATDTVGYARDHGVSLGGMGMGFLLGSMLSRSHAAYPGGRTDLRSANVQPRGYHGTAQSSYRARTSGGSSSFRSGK